MEPQKNIKDIFCPECRESLIFPNPRWDIIVGKEVKTKIFLTKEGKKQYETHKKRTFLSDLKIDAGTPFDRVLFFLIAANNNRSGFLELSVIPGDYSKYCSVELHPEEEVTFICPHCHKAINKDGLVKILVEFEGKKDEVWEYFLSARYGVEVTLYQKNGEVGSYRGKKYKASKYLEIKEKEITSRK